MNKLEANVSLLSVTICWSVQIFFMQNVPDSVPVFAFMALTNLLGFALLCLVYRGEIRNINAALLGKGIGLAALNSITNLFFIFGARRIETSSPTALFSGSFYVVIVPVFVMLILKKRQPVFSLVASGFALAGLLLPVISDFCDGLGLPLMLLGNVAFSLYILLLDHYAKSTSPSLLAVTQLLFSFVFSFAGWVVINPSSVVTLRFDGVPLFNAAFLSSVFVVAIFVRAYSTVMQIYAQRYVAPVNATFIFSTEIVFSLLFLTVIPPLLGKPARFPNILELAGAALLMAGIIFSSIGERAESGGLLWQIRKFFKPKKPRKPVKKAGTPKPVPQKQSANSKERDAIKPKSLRIWSGLASTRTWIVFFITILLYASLNLCFRTMFRDFPFSGPAAVLPVCMGLMFGYPAAFGVTIGALLSDIAGQTLSISTAAACAANFLSAAGAYFLWYLKRDTSPPIMKRARNILKFCLLAMTAGLLSACLTSLNSGAPFATVVVLNSMWPIVFGLPVVIVMGSLLSVKFQIPRHVKLPPEPNIFSKTVPNRADSIGELCDALLEYCEIEDIDTGKAYNIMLAVEEMLVNVIENAYPDERESLIKLSVRPGQVIAIRMEDDGIPFNPLNFTKQRKSIFAGLKRIFTKSGPDIDALGIILVARMSIKTQYRRVGDKNLLEILL